MNKLQEVVQKFRSGSVDAADKATTFNLSGDEAGARSRTFSATEVESKKDQASGSSRHHANQDVWVTSASHPSPFSPPPSGAKGQSGSAPRTQGNTTWFLPDLSLQNTSLTSDVGPDSAGNPEMEGQAKTSSGTTALTNQELHDSVLSYLSDVSKVKLPSTSDPNSPPAKSPLEKKLSKKQPKGTFEYIVKEGDTLVKIGAHFDVTPSELLKINRMATRTVFTGQILFLPDPDYVPSDPPTPKSASPVPDTRPKVDIPLSSMADRPPAAVPGHVVPVTSPSKQAKVVTSTTSTAPLTSQNRQLSYQSEEDESDKEVMQKFLKMPVRRVMEEEGESSSEEVSYDSEGFTIKGTLLVTPNAIMFDADVNDPLVIMTDDQLKFSMVVYMEEIKGVALFHDISPRMFWRQPKELRAHSPRPETYRSGQGRRPKVEGQDEKAEEARSRSSSQIVDPTRLAPDGASVGDRSQTRASPDGGELPQDGKDETATGRTSEELEKMSEIAGHPESRPQPGRASEEVEHALSRSQGHTPNSPMMKQMSRSSELEVSEISQLQESSDVFSHSRDFGPHMGRSSSEVHRQVSSSLGQVSDASPGDPTGRAFFAERSDSTTDTLNTPTHGFAPVHFTDRSPKSVLAHPKPVSGQRALLLSQSPVPSSDLKSQENRIAEDAEAGSCELEGSGQFDVSTSTNDKVDPQDDSSNDLSSNTEILSATDKKLPDSDVSDQPETSGPDRQAAAKPGTDGEDTKPAAIEDAATQSDSPLPAKDGESDQTEQEDAVTAQVQNLTLTDKDDQEAEAAESPKLMGPLSPFSSLRAPAQQLSSLFNYTTSLFRNTGSVDKERSNSSSSTPPLTPNTTTITTTSSQSKAKVSAPLSPTPSSTNVRLELKSGFTKEDMNKALGPDPKHFLPRSDSPHFEDAPLYLQIRPGIQRNIEKLQPRAFDHRNISKLLEEYWFVVPRDMGDKLYNFLMEWQPDAYGDEEETQTRDKFFYDMREVAHLIQPVKKKRGSSANKGGGDGNVVKLPVAEDHFSEVEKTWEILSKEEVYGAEKSQALSREETIDESNLPELVEGPSQIIEHQHIMSLLRSVPRHMSAGYNWQLVYATHRHGYSLQNLYTHMETVEDSPVLLFIKDSYESVFGAYLSNNIKPSETFYGSGGTFLFTFYPEYKKFPWQGDNQFFMNGTKDFFAIGSGEGVFGLWLDGDLNKGRSHQCTTFHNDVLTVVEDFNIIDLEVWTFVDSSLL